MRAFVTRLDRICRALRRPAAGPPPKLNEPAPARTGGGLWSTALGGTCRILLRRWHQAKAARRARAVRIRVVLEAVVADQRKGGV